MRPSGADTVMKPSDTGTGAESVPQLSAASAAISSRMAKRKADLTPMGASFVKIEHSEPAMHVEVHGNCAGFTSGRGPPWPLLPTYGHVLQIESVGL